MGGHRKVHWELTTSEAELVLQVLEGLTADAVLELGDIGRRVREHGMLVLRYAIARSDLPAAAHKRLGLAQQHPRVGMVFVRSGERRVVIVADEIHVVYETSGTRWTCTRHAWLSWVGLAFLEEVTG